MKRMQPVSWALCTFGAALGLSVVLGLGETSASGARMGRLALGPPPPPHQIYSMNADGTDPTNL